MDPQTLPAWAEPTTEDLNAAAIAWEQANETAESGRYGPANIAGAKALIARVLARMPKADGRVSLFHDINAYGAILAERDKQIGLGYTPKSDDSYTSGDLVRVAECLLFAAQGIVEVAKETWPWDNWQPACFTAATPPTAEDRRKLLVKAAALIVAELSRLDRASETAGAA